MARGWSDYAYDIRRRTAAKRARFVVKNSPRGEHMPVDPRETYPARQEKLSMIRQLDGSVKYNGDNYARNAGACGKGSTAGDQALVEDLNSGGLGRASKTG